MWLALASWAVAQRPILRPADLQGQALLNYLASRSGQQAAHALLTPRYQQRLVSLVRRVQAHQAWRRQQAAAGPAQALALASGGAAAGRRPPLLPASHPDDGPEPPLHLLPAQADQLQALLARSADDALGRWQQLRDRCAVALQLGAGLGPGDVRALRLTDVRPGPSGLHSPRQWQLQVAANGSAPAHAAPLADWAAAVLARWLALRQAQALGGPWLLPSTRSGKPWGKVAQYEAARRVLADAGLDPDGGGSFRLRHSFAMRQLQPGQDPARVAGWLGVVDPQVMLRYQRAMASAAAPANRPQPLAAPPPWPV